MREDYNDAVKFYYTNGLNGGGRFRFNRRYQIVDDDVEDRLNMRADYDLHPLPTRPLPPLYPDVYDGITRRTIGVDIAGGYGSLTWGTLGLEEKYGTKKSFGVMGQGESDKQGYSWNLDTEYTKPSK